MDHLLSKEKVKVGLIEFQRYVFYLFDLDIIRWCILHLFRFERLGSLSSLFFENWILQTCSFR